MTFAVPSESCIGHAFLPGSFLYKMARYFYVHLILSPAGHNIAFGWLWEFFRPPGYIKIKRGAFFGTVLFALCKY